jgi:hypothetical protein
MGSSQGEAAIIRCIWRQRKRLQLFLRHSGVVKADLIRALLTLKRAGVLLSFDTICGERTILATEGGLVEGRSRRRSDSDGKFSSSVREVRDYFSCPSRSTLRSRLFRWSSIATMRASIRARPSPDLGLLLTPFCTTAMA